MEENEKSVKINKIYIYRLIPLVLSIIPAILILQMGISFLSTNWIYLLIGLILVSAALIKKEYMEKSKIFQIIVMYLIISISYSFYLDPAIGISRSAGTVLSGNWYNGLTWIRDNTEECATIATYWDPGHFIRAIAKRPAVFDGGSQNSKLMRPTNVTENRVDIVPYENGITRIIEYKDKKRITARIQDIATSMLTTNESLAIEVLKDYKVPGCSKMYFLATSDLIGKSTWWTYFSTWSPEKEGDKGNRYFYSLVNLAQTRPIQSQNTVAFIYPISQSQAIVVYDSNGQLTPYIQQGNQFLQISKIFYFTQTQSVLTEFDNPQVQGLLWVDPSRQVVVLIPPELEDSMFTKMFFFNGAGLNNFEFVNSWGGEVKLFKINFPEENQ